MAGEPLKPGCTVCGGATNLRCSRCKIIAYCGREHQTAYFREHKDTCREVARARASLKEEEEKLLEYFAPHNPFMNPSALFGRMARVCPYLEAHCQYIFALGDLNDYHALQIALEQAFDWLRIDRHDRTHVKCLVLPMLIRSGRDQEGYEYLRQWCKDDQNPCAAHERADPRYTGNSRV